MINRTNCMGDTLMYRDIINFFQDYFVFLCSKGEEMDILLMTMKKSLSNCKLLVFELNSYGRYIAKADIKFFETKIKQLEECLIKDKIASY